MEEGLENDMSFNSAVEEGAWKEFIDLQYCLTYEDVLRHPADAERWKHFDYEFLEFALDPRNVRLGLTSDGFNSFGHISTVYNIWSVVLIPYNFPPWKCMKESNIFMSLLIPNRRSPGREIDVYLQPLIEELKELCSLGVRTYDSLTEYQTWLICMRDKSSFEIRGKIASMGHRRYLPDNHV
ncbi:hypothetical protein E5676_scaffold87G00550 [Cucumis melo var. makuwa]|uniref:Uncharacterized protein n=1 Tax=Cucumis melo var. makuwa TaxID=1194695 RepID=A0A5D3CBI3_CUCMM|nr:hypothetical protein E5676_scaffold87G00550 [Cucumis melo var. makuwa]